MRKLRPSGTGFESSIRIMSYPPYLKSNSSDHNVPCLVSPHSLAVHAALVTLAVDDNPPDLHDHVILSPSYPVNADQNLRCPSLILKHKNIERNVESGAVIIYYLTWKVDHDVAVLPPGALDVEPRVRQLGEAGRGLVEVVLGHQAVSGRHQPGGAQQGRRALHRGARLEVEHRHEGITETYFSKQEIKHGCHSSCCASSPPMILS